MEVQSHMIEADAADGYSSSSNNEDVEKSLLWAGNNGTSTERRFKDRSSNTSPSLRLHLWITVVNMIFFIISGVMMWASFKHDHITLQDHWRATSHFSPVFDRFKIPKISRTTNGTLFDTKPPSIWRARTGKEADIAWDRIGSTVPPIAITADEVRAIGKNPDTAVRFPEEFGHGPDAYMASIEVFHHVHCLDKLRKEISYKHYWEKEEGPAPGGKMHEAHISHCIDVLAQALRCTGSVDIITYNWVDGRDMMFPDFENHKVCRDFDALLGWVDENGVQMDESRYKAMKPPSGTQRIPNPFKMPHGFS